MPGDASSSNYLNDYIFSRLSLLTPEVADNYTVDFSAEQPLVVQVSSIYFPSLEVEIGFDPRSTATPEKSSLVFNTYLSSYLQNFLCGYYYENRHSGHDGAIGDASDDIVRINLKKLVAERMIWSHNAPMGYALMFEFLCTGDPRMRNVFDYLQSTPETQRIGRFFQSLSTDFIFWHEIGHVIYRRVDPAVGKLRDIAAQMGPDLLAAGVEPEFVDVEEIFCDLNALRMCGIKFTHNMPLVELVPILAVLVRFFALAITAAGHADALLDDNDQLPPASDRSWMDSINRIWPRAMASLRYLRMPDFQDFVDEYKHYADFDQVPVAVRLKPFSDASMSWAMTNVLDTEDRAIHRAAKIAAEAIVKTPDEARRYILDVGSTRSLAKSVV